MPPIGLNSTMELSDSTKLKQSIMEAKRKLSVMHDKKMAIEDTLKSMRRQVNI